MGFRKYLPYRTDFGWYPFARVTGFFNEPGYGHSLPSLSVVMTEFRRPKPFEEVGRAFFSFLEKELKSPNWLDQRSSLILAAYALPIVTAGSSVDRFKAGPEEKLILDSYISEAGADLPIALKGWYDSAVS